MIPHPWMGLLLGLAAYRLARLVGWDDFPLAVRIRAWLIGERWVPDGPIGRVEELEVSRQGVTIHGTLNRVGEQVVAGEEIEPPQPGKEPSSEVGNVRPVYDRPTFAHLIHCPFCQGFWVSVAVYTVWTLVGAPAAEPWHSWMLYPVGPFALSGFVGLVAKNLDP